MINKNLSSDFRRISLIILIFAVFISVVLSAVVYWLEDNKRKNSYPEIAEQFDSSLIYDLTHTEYYTIILGKKILNVGADNLKSIFQFMSEGMPETMSNIYSWTYMDWLDDKGMLRVNSKQGVLHSPIDLSNRIYVPKTQRMPWKLILDKPILGVPSGEYVLPAVLGVEKSDGQYVGTIAVEFSVRKIRDKLMDLASDFGCEFFILDNDNNILIASSELITMQDSFFQKNNISDLSGVFKKGVNYKDKILLEYQSYSKYYPFKIVLGHDNKVFYQILVKDILPKVIAIMFVALFSIYLLTVLKTSIVSSLENLSYLVSDNQNISSLPRKSKYIEIAQLALNISKIQSFNKTLKEAVAKQTQHLQKALKVKQEFLNNISHEVRTPLQGILGISTELNRRWDSIDDNDKKNYVKIMADSGERLMQLMSNILDLSRFEGEKMKFSFRACKVKNLLEDAVKNIQPLLVSKKTLTLETSIKIDENTRVKCDRMRILQVLNNILSNAIKYSDKGHIQIEVKKLAKELLVSVSDTGVGIPKKELKEVFNPFVESSITKSKAGGKGIGLALCKEIIAAHSGEIWVESDGKGSTFFFTIPM